MGLFKSIKDLKNLTKQAQQLGEQQRRRAGYKPGLRGMASQMGDLVAEGGRQLEQLRERSADQERLLAEGIAGEAVIVGMGTPARDAQRYNLDIDLEVYLPDRAPYRVAQQYIVPAGAALGRGVRLPVRVDPDDPARIAIDWDGAARAPARGEIRPAEAPTPQADGDETLAALEQLVRLREAGALTDAEFEQQKARILGGG